MLKLLGDLTVLAVLVMSAMAVGVISFGKPLPDPTPPPPPVQTYYLPWTQQALRLRNSADGVKIEIRSRQECLRTTARDLASTQMDLDHLQLIKDRAEVITTTTQCLNVLLPQADRYDREVAAAMLQAEKELAYQEEYVGRSRALFKWLRDSAHQLESERK